MFSYPETAFGMCSEIEMEVTFGLLLNFPGVNYLICSFEKDHNLFFTGS